MRSHVPSAVGKYLGIQKKYFIFYCENIVIALILTLYTYIYILYSTLIHFKYFWNLAVCQYMRKFISYRYVKDINFIKFKTTACIVFYLTFQYYGTHTFFWKILTRDILKFKPTK